MVSISGEKQFNDDDMMLKTSLQGLENMCVVEKHGCELVHSLERMEQRHKR